ncbi:MAG: efflux RND transporter periplasmic adaptor subunit [Draconibacterium sp.]
MKRIYLFSICILTFAILTSCVKHQKEETEETVVAKASVKTTYAVKGNIKDNLVLNGKTVYLKKNQVVSPISGYITAVNIKLGDQVQTGDVLFEIETRENQALQQMGKAGSEYGKIKVLATTSGIVNEPVTLGTGAYVVEGSPLCSLVDNKDLLVQVNVPYENHNLIKLGNLCYLLLPDGTEINGSVYQIRPFVNESSQTQEVLIKPSGARQLPENMNLTASFQKAESNNTLLINKKALLTDETQTEFWVMKIVQDSVAIQVPVETGIKTDSMVEIISSGLTPEDIIILEGGYGLEDSSLVNIIREP